MILTGIISARPVPAQTQKDVLRRQAEQELKVLQQDLEHQADSLDKLTRREEEAQVRSRALREEVELLDKVRARLENKYRRLGREFSTCSQRVRQLEQARVLRQEILGRTIVSLQRAQVATTLERFSGIETNRRRFFGQLVSEALSNQVNATKDSLNDWQGRSAGLAQDQQLVKTAIVGKEKEKGGKERLVARTEREAFGYRQKREHQLIEIEEKQRAAMMLAELVDRLIDLPGIQKIIDYDFPGWKGRLHWPLKGQVQSVAGLDVAPPPQARGRNTPGGIFISGTSGTTVVNAADGEVAFAGRRRGLGNVVIMAHGGDYFSVFAHLGDLAVLVGQTISAGEPIGVAGSSHPHFGSGVLLELRHIKEPLDPLEWLR